MASFQNKTSAQFRDDFLRSVKNALITVAGIQNPNVSFGTDHYILGEAIGKIAEVASLNAIAAADAQMPDTATGEDLARIGAIYDLKIKPAGPSSGNLILESTATVGLVSGTQLIDPNGLRYQVSVGGVYSNGSAVPFTSIDTGSATNIAEGTVLRWVSAPAFVGPTALVDVGGATGGVDAEDDEQFRARILNRLRHPVGGGNWPQFAAFAEDSTAAVQKAFVYPAYNGPSTVLVCPVTAQTLTNKNRNVNSVVLETIVKPAVLAGVFEGIDCQVITCQNQEAQVSIGLTLPSSPNASPPGPGGGWLDGSPWPVNAGEGFVAFQNVVDINQFLVETDFAPVPNVTRFCYIDDKWNILHLKVTAVTGTGPDYLITTDLSLPNAQIGDWIFPDAVNIEEYIAALLAAFNSFGPGQINDLPGLQPFNFRRPLTSESNPSDLGPAVLRILSDTGEEVLDVQFLFKNPSVPSLPTNVKNGPFILVPKPKQIGFYPLPEI